MNLNEVNSNSPNLKKNKTKTDRSKFKFLAITNIHALKKSEIFDYILKLHKLLKKANKKIKKYKEKLKKKVKIQEIIFS